MPIYQANQQQQVYDWNRMTAWQRTNLQGTSADVTGAPGVMAPMGTNPMRRPWRMPMRPQNGPRFMSDAFQGFGGGGSYAATDSGQNYGTPAADSGIPGVFNMNYGTPFQYQRSNFGRMR